MPHSLHTVAEFEAAILKFFPKGEYWEDKDNKIEALISNQATIAKEVEANLISLHNDTNPTTTDNFIDKWESAFNIENDSSKSLDDRRDFLILTIQIIYNEYILQKIVNILHPLKYNITDNGDNNYDAEESLNGSKPEIELLFRTHNIFRVGDNLEQPLCDKSMNFLVYVVSWKNRNESELSEVIKNVEKYAYSHYSIAAKNYNITNI